QQIGVRVSEVYRLAERVAAGEQVDFADYLRHRGRAAQPEPVAPAAPPGRTSIVSVPVMAAEGSMGGGRLAPEHNVILDVMRLSASWIRSNLTVSRPDNLAVLAAYGDSMDPTFRDGDILLVDRGVNELRL